MEAGAGRAREARRASRVRLRWLLSSRSERGCGRGGRAHGFMRSLPLMGSSMPQCACGAGKQGRIRRRGGTGRDTAHLAAGQSQSKCFRTDICELGASSFPPIFRQFLDIPAYSHQFPAMSGYSRLSGKRPGQTDTGSQKTGGFGESECARCRMRAAAGPAAGHSRASAFAKATRDRSGSQIQSNPLSLHYGATSRVKVLPVGHRRQQIEDDEEHEDEED